MKVGSIKSPYTLVLASNSPRRKEFLNSLGWAYTLRIAEVDESYPEGLKAGAITDYIAVKKAGPLRDGLKKNEILLTADTLVWSSDHVLGKPMNTDHARDMLLQMSGQWHEVITSVALTTQDQQTVFHQSTQVKFAELSSNEIDAYVSSGQALDKAGAYGIQDWIGLIGIEEINGSYSNVVGLPTALLYQNMKSLGYIA